LFSRYVRELLGSIISSDVGCKLVADFLTY